MPFWELTVRAASEVSEGLTNFLWEQGALGVVEEEIPGAEAMLRAFYPGTASSTRLLRGVDAYVASLRALGLTRDGARPTVTPLVGEPWAEAWRQAFVPLAVGRRLLIVPPWDIPATGDGRTPVIIEPGRAFGTGSHASTRGCLMLLERLLEDRLVSHALDIGTGTGILAIAAALLGVERITALDTDPDAIAAARANAARNGVAERMDCACAGPADVQGETAPLVVANLLAGSHVALAPEYRRVSPPDGHLILGGVLAEETGSVTRALQDYGFALAEQVDIEGWVSLGLTG